ncbi:hypothetical protein ACOZ4Y_02715 [Komagataeibacter rhaeticus]
MSESANALEVIQTLTPQVVFQNGGVEDIISKLERDVRAMPVDPTTEKGRKEIKSIAHKVARSKTALDGMGKEVQAEAKAVVDRVNAERRVICSRLDALRDEVRRPVDEYEAREKERVEAHQTAIREIEYLARFDTEPDEALVAQRIDALSAFEGRDWQEFSARGAQAYGDAERNLNAHGVAAKARREVQEEAARQAAIEAEKEHERQEEARKAREAEIARKAAEDARLAAERRAQAERDRVEREKRDAEERAARAEQEKIAAAKRAEAARVAAAEKAERDRQAAVAAERRRIEDEKRREQQEAERRANDRAHKAKVNGDALRALTVLGLSDDLGKAVITAIVQGKVPHVTLTY